MSNELKYQKSAQSLRRLRQNIFNYPAELEAQADRVLHYLKSRLLRDRQTEMNNAVVGPYSGLTRKELGESGTCEPDWF